MSETIINVYFSFSFIANKKRKKSTKRKRKYAAVSYALTGIEYVLRLTSKARPVNRLSYVHYRCLRSTFAALPALYLHPPLVGGSKSLISGRGK